MATIRERLDKLCDAFNAHDLDRIMSLFADDCILEMPRGDKPWGARFEGKDAVRAALATRFSGLPDVHYGNAEHFVDETAGIGMSKWTLTGTPSSGKKLEVRGCDFYSFRDGQVIRKDSYWKIVADSGEGGHCLRFKADSITVIADTCSRRRLEGSQVAILSSSPELVL